MAELRSQPLTYPRGDGAGPSGYARFSRSRVLDVAVDFDSAVHALMTWQVQVRSGLRVAASAPRIETDAVVVMRIGPGQVALTISAFSRPATTLARLGGPLTAQVQRLMTWRYLHTLDRTG